MKFFTKAIIVFLIIIFLLSGFRFFNPIELIDENDKEKRYVGQ
jgi:hypothetical protein